MVWLIVAFVIWVIVSAACLVGMTFRIGNLETQIIYLKIEVERLGRLKGEP